MGFRILGAVLVLFKYLWSKTLKKTTAKSDIYHSSIYPFLLYYIYSIYLLICPQIQKRCRNILHTELETVFKEHEMLIMVLVRILILGVPKFITDLLKIYELFFRTFLAEHTSASQAGPKLKKVHQRAWKNFSRDFKKIWLYSK